MKTKEQIINDSIKEETPPADYNMIEIQCFLALKQLLVMFHNRQISKEKAGITKNKILAKYESDSKQYEFERSMFQEHIEHIKQTENARVKLHKMLNGKEPYNKPVTEESMAETINICLEIINIIFPKEFI